MAASSAGGPSNMTRRLSTITWSRSSATAPSSCETSSTAAACSLHEVHERVAEQLLRLDVDAGDRLVEHEELGLGGERLRDQRALLLTARQLGEPPAPVVGECDRLERVVDRVAVGGTAPPPPALLGQATGGDDLGDGGGEVGRDAECVGGRSPPASGRGGRRGAVPNTLDRTRPRARAARAGCAATSTSRSRSVRPSAANSPGAHREAHVRRAPARGRRRTTRRRRRARPVTLRS